MQSKVGRAYCCVSVPGFVDRCACIATQGRIRIEIFLGGGKSAGPIPPPLGVPAEFTPLPLSVPSGLEQVDAHEGCVACGSPSQVSPPGG